MPFPDRQEEHPPRDHALEDPMPQICTHKIVHSALSLGLISHNPQLTVQNAHLYTRCHLHATKMKFSKLRANTDQGVVCVICHWPLVDTSFGVLREFGWQKD